MSSIWWVVFRKELRETLRDRRTLFIMIAVPVLLYPVVLIGTEQLFLFGARNLEAETSRVAIVGTRPPELVSLLEANETLDLEPVAGDPVEAVRHQIRELIAAETAKTVLSDERIVEILRSDGVDIARRTVAKYRDALRIPSSVERRRMKRAHAAL